jgi:hypothetical protein
MGGRVGEGSARAKKDRAGRGASTGEEGSNGGNTSGKRPTGALCTGFTLVYNHGFEFFQTIKQPPA